jgi:hypothetical protein
VLFYNIALDFPKLRFLSIQEKILLIGHIKKGIVSSNNGLGIAREMCPELLIIRAEDSLIDSLLYNLTLDERREC